MADINQDSTESLSLGESPDIRLAADSFTLSAGVTFTESGDAMANLPLDPLAIWDSYLEADGENLASVAGYHAPSAKTENTDAFMAPGWYEVFFNRIIVIPESIEAGSVLSDQTYNILLYLAYNNRSSLELTGINNPDSSLELTGPGTGNHYAGAILSYSLKIKGSADESVIDAVIQWLFTGLDPAELPVTGNRSALWPWPAQEGATESFEFKTALLQAYSQESRSQLRTTPDQHYSFDMVLTAEQQAEFETSLYTRANFNWGVPLWHEARPTTSDVTIGDLILQVAPGNTTIPNSTDIALYDGTNLESLRIDSQDASSITIKKAVALCQGQCWVMPVRSGKLTAGVKNTLGQGKTGRGNVKFWIKNPVLIAQAASLTLDGIEILDRPSLVDITRGYKQEYDKYDNGIVNPIYYLKRAKQGNTSEIKWRLTTEAERYYARTLIERLAGQHTVFWLPSHKAEVILSEDTLTDALSIKATIPDYENLNQLVPAIAIRNSNGISYRLVDSISQDSETGIFTITFTGSLPEIYTQADTEISIMRKYRCNSDTLTLTHSRAAVELSLPIMEVHNE